MVSELSSVLRLLTKLRLLQKLQTGRKKYADGAIVYDDGSTDDTSVLAIAAGATVIESPKNTGYGSAIRDLYTSIAFLRDTIKESQ